MLTRTRNALVLAGLALVAAAALGFTWKHRRTPDARHAALDAIPTGALLVGTADLDALRASPIGTALWKQSRDIPGLGKVRDVCGFDPIDQVHELAVGIPPGGEAGDFGLAGAGDVDADAVVACATKVISARGGDPVTSVIGSFRVVRDAANEAGGGEIAVRAHGPVLLGAGDYLRRMIDAADGHAPTIRASLAHGDLARAVGDGAVRITVVLTPEQRKALAVAIHDEGSRGSPAASIAAAAIAVRLDAKVGISAVLACDDDRACSDLAGLLRAARDARAGDMATRLVGIGALLERIRIDAEGPAVRAAVELPVDEASTLLDRVLTLRGFRHPMPEDARTAHPSASDAGAPPIPDEILSAAPPRDAGAPPTHRSAP